MTNARLPTWRRAQRRKRWTVLYLLLGVSTARGFRPRATYKVVATRELAARGHQEPWAFERSHSERARSPKRGNVSEWCEIPGTSSVRCVATAQHHLVWRRRPETVLVLAKLQASDDEVAMAIKIARAFAKCGARVFLAQPLYGRVKTDLDDVKPALWRSEDEPAVPGAVADRPDIVATLGGDGLLLYMNSLFQTQSPPPLVAFSGGSLGFLAPFDVPDDVSLLQTMLQPCFGDDPWPVSLRMRLSCSVTAKDGTARDKHEALNEVVIDRGTSPYLAAVDCFCNDEYFTTVQADGLIVATPTGSTAYSLAAGGPLVHPASPAVVLTPICAHSLSFRPMVFPDSAHLRFVVQDDARAPAWVTFDGRRRCKLEHGDSLEVTVSPFPLPTLLRNGNTADWFGGLRDAFSFNTRVLQKPLQPSPTPTSPPAPAPDAAPSSSH